MTDSWNPGSWRHPGRRAGTRGYLGSVRIGFLNGSLDSGALFALQASSGRCLDDGSDQLKAA